jgi:hypothetical protein
MRSERAVSPWRLASCALLTWGVLAGATAQAQPAPAVQGPSVSQVEAAVERLRQDPNLPGTERKHELRWKERDFGPRESESRPETPQLDWTRGLAQWLSSTGRVLVWVLGAIAVIFVLLGVRHWMRERAQGPRRALAAPPSHVRDLDIRPESLPAQIGPQARALWQRGEQRAALSLLYRGTLSRLVHGHGVAITAASTEGDCLRLARARLDAARGDFVAQLIGAWQLAVYGGRMPADAAVFALCEAFDAHLGAHAAPPSPAAPSEVTQ